MIKLVNDFGFGNKIAHKMIKENNAMMRSLVFLKGLFSLNYITSQKITVTLNFDKF